MTFTLGLDVGGTKIAAVVLDHNGTVVDDSVVPTDGHGISVIAQIWNLIDQKASSHALGGVGVAVPGNVDPSSGTVISAPNIRWDHVDLPTLIEPALRGSAEVSVINDANAAAWAEYRFGEQNPGDSFAMITVGTGTGTGTGIGGGFVLNGRLLNGATGAGGEIGHLTLIPDGEACSCGSKGCWERYASGSALHRAAVQAGWGPEKASHQLLESVGTRPEAEKLATTIQHLIRGMGLVAGVLDPTVIVLGGGLGTDPVFFDSEVAYYQELRITPPRSRPRLGKAHLGPLAGAIGAADLARPHARNRQCCPAASVMVNLHFGAQARQAPLGRSGVARHQRAHPGPGGGATALRRRRSTGARRRRRPNRRLPGHHALLVGFQHPPGPHAGTLQSRSQGGLLDASGAGSMRVTSHAAQQVKKCNPR
ncbi:hypothetical protein CQ020_16915 [Arthrobacter sp. MYb23]|uniref:ROK family protein n=1 Tax=unclassified Arthrobacter TaxID=235627 RepID=UPI000CFB1BC1|nr:MULTISPECIES: ROK family protein [unclassified Arthrobacter]PRB43456.1 hypothetical protein CQ038_07430 [Arthrobacter sp. MYb51]PRB93700.1 hypothetical protein CQ020_16915 [Arthrobacter sp. MYb23]